MSIILPPKNLMPPQTNSEDPLKYYYWPVVGWFYKKRLLNTLALLGDGKKYDSLLEIAFGAGILFPELSKRAYNLFGIEIHNEIAEVEKMLAFMNVRAELKQASLFSIPYPDAMFDAVVAVSVYEHIPELDRAMMEVKRVLKKGGIAILSFPVRNIITDSFFRLVGFNPRKIHPSGHRDIMAAASRHFEIEESLFLPAFLPMDLCLYCTLRCRN